MKKVNRYTMTSKPLEAKTLQKIAGIIRSKPQGHLGTENGIVKLRKVEPKSLGRDKSFKRQAVSSYLRE